MFSYLRNTLGRTPSDSDAGARRHAAAIALLAEPARTPEQERSVERLEARLFFDETLLAAASRVRPIARGSLVLGLLLGLMVSATVPGVASAAGSNSDRSESVELGSPDDEGSSLWDLIVHWLEEEAGLLGDEEQSDREGNG